MTITMSFEETVAPYSQCQNCDMTTYCVYYYYDYIIFGSCCISCIFEHSTEDDMDVLQK